MLAKIALALCLVAGTAQAATADSKEPINARVLKNATVVIPTGTIQGNVMNGVESFGGIPYASPATGKLRLRPPVRRTDSLGVFDATGPAAACPQMIASDQSRSLLFDLLGDVSALPLVRTVTGQTEDCLTITVARPEGTNADAKLPVLYWIFGGGFELGWSSMYDGTGLVQHGVSIDEPFVFVAVNYRVAGWGFMPGKEILKDGAANLGLLDQRMGLEWVADNIAAFGGDPSKVTIWGESAGAISVFDQMALYGGDNTYKGQPLFRGAIMNSGSIIPTDPVDCPKGQVVYDQVVKEAGCTGASDTLGCLRSLDYHTFYRAVISVPGLLSYSSLALSYLPRPDGKVLPESPDVLGMTGKIAAVPFIIGDQEDEGTLFAIFQPNLTTTDDLASYLKDFYFASATDAEMKELVLTYGDGTDAVVNGSPFRTGLLNEIFPGFKRRAAILGDLVFTLSRRIMLSYVKKLFPLVPTWSYLASQNYGTPIAGTLHGSDILQVFFGIKDNYAARSQRTYYINFLYNQDPNVGASGYPSWPRWSQGSKIPQFFADSSQIIGDDFRSGSAEWIDSHLKRLYF